MLDAVRRIVLSYMKRPTKVMKKRSPAQRLKSRLYYRTHKNQIRLARRRYSHQTKIFSKVRKVNKRPKPKWLHKAISSVTSPKKPKINKPGPIKKYVKKMISRPKLPKAVVKHAPKTKRHKIDVPR